jgi:hypothetical protein
MAYEQDDSAASVVCVVVLLLLLLLPRIDIKTVQQGSVGDFQVSPIASNKPLKKVE